MPTTFLDGRVTLHAGDCIEVLAAMPDASVDSVVCDPPYHLTSIVKRYGKTSIDAEGTILDPFAGTGTTGEAAWREGMRAILIEREAEYQADIARRMELAENPTKRAAVAKTKNNLGKAEDLPLFAVPFTG